MFKYIILYLIVLNAIINVQCLYEDQVGNWDWKQSYIGKIKYFHPLSLSKSQTNLIGSESNVVSSVYLRNGTIRWRMALEPKGNLQAFAIDDEQNGLNLDEYSDKELITINNDGLYVRSWQPITGALNWERRLPEELIRHKDERSEVNFLINAKTNEIVISKFYPTNDNKLILYLYVYDYLKDEIVRRDKQPVNGQIDDLRSCRFVSAKSLVCLNVKNLTIDHYSFDQVNSQEKLTNFFQQSNIDKLQLIELDYQTNEESPVFGLNLNDGVTLIKVINNNKLTLMKKFTEVDCITLKKVGVDGVLKTFTFALKSKLEGDLHQFKVSVYDMVEWSELRNLQEHFVIKYKGRLEVEKFFILPFNKLQDKYQYKIVISTKDASLILLSSSHGNGKINWIREEALSSVISAEIIDYPLNELDAEIESLDLLHTDVYGQFVKRIKSQISQLQTSTSNLIQKLNELINTSSKENQDLNDNLNLDYALYAEDNQELIRDSFGFHKLIVALTKYGKLFGIDTLKGKIIWSLSDETLQNHLKDYLKDDENKRVPIHIQRTTSHHPFQAVGTIVLKNGYILSVDLIKGEIISRQHLNTNLKQMILLNQLDTNNLKGLLLFDQTNKVHFYPPSVYEEVFQNVKDKYYLVTADQNTGVLEGYSFSNLDTDRRATKIWSTNIPVSSVKNNMKMIFKNPLEQVHSLGRVLGDRNVLYKYLNPNLIAVVNEGVDTSSTNGQSVDLGSKKPSFISIYLVDAITGQIIHSTIHQRCSNVHVVHTENSLVYGYFNEKYKRTELSAIDLYEGETMTNFTAFSSLNRPFYLHPAIVQHATFIFPTGITAMSDTRTEKGITNKNILIALPYGGIVSMPKFFLDPRRPINPTPDHREEGLMPYLPELPIPAENIINYNQTVINVKEIITAPATLESTSHTFVFGLDLFYTRVTPSKTFDILKEDFEYWLIALVLFLLVLFSYLSKVLCQKKTLNNAWK